MPIGIGTIYALVTLSQLGRLAAATNLSGDSASAPVIGDLFGHGRVTLGHMPWYSTLLFELATRWLPGHRQLWEGTPWLLVLMAAAIIGWSTARLAGRWAGAMSAVIVVCEGPSALSALLAINAHAPTWLTLAVLGGWLVVLLTVELGKATAVAGTVVVGVIAGVNGASDNTLILSGWLPFALVGVVLLRASPTHRVWRVTRLMAGTLVIGVIAGGGLRVLMSALDVHPEPFSLLNFITPDKLPTTVDWWLSTTALLGDGGFFGQTLGMTSALQLVCGLMAVLAVLATIRLGWRAALSPSQREPDAQTTGRALAWRAYVAFWGLSALAMALGYVLNSQTEPGDVAFRRYIVGEIYAAAAVVPLLMTRGTRWRTLIMAGVTVFAFTGLVTRVQSQLLRAQDSIASPSAQIANEIVSAARVWHVTTGYTGYWDAAPLTWAARYAVKIYPVFTCGQTICPYPEHFISSWFVPRRGQRSFLIVDPVEAFVQAAPQALGKPLATIPLTTDTMYVYPYDIASRLGSAPCNLC